MLCIYQPVALLSVARLFILHYNIRPIHFCLRCCSSLSPPSFNHSRTQTDELFISIETTRGLFFPSTKRWGDTSSFYSLPDGCQEVNYSFQAKEWYKNMFFLKGEAAFWDVGRCQTLDVGRVVDDKGAVPHHREVDGEVTDVGALVVVLRR